MPILNDQPITIPAKTYGLWYLAEFVASTPDPARPPFVNATFRPYRSNGDGTGEFGPGSRTHSIPDLWAKLAADPAAAAVFAQLMAYVEQDAKAAWAALDAPQAPPAEFEPQPEPAPAE